jgi:flagellar protein FliS
MMFAPHKTAAASYRTLDVQTMVDSADPHRLVEMLYDGAVMQVAKARFALGRNEIAAKGEATTRAIRIIDEGLKAPLDVRAGDIARNLGALYDYMTRTPGERQPEEQRRPLCRGGEAARRTPGRLAGHCNEGPRRRSGRGLNVGMDRT